MKKYAYAWITLGFFAVSVGLHWLLGWFTFVDEATEHGVSPELAPYLVLMARDTFENWQSEFVQLLQPERDVVSSQFNARRYVIGPATQARPHKSRFGGPSAMSDLRRRES